MARQTKIRKGSIDLDSVFSPGFMVDTDGRLISGYKWTRYVPTLNPNDLSITAFQMNDEPHVVDNIILLYMFVNGVKVEPDYLTLDPAEATIVNYDDSDYPITSDDLVEFWFVPTATVGGQPVNDPATMPQAAGAGGHLQINDGNDQITFAPIKWILNALVPDDDISYDLGTPTKRWNDLYLNSNSIHLGDIVLSVDPQTQRLSVDGTALPNATDVEPATLIADQDFLDAITGPQGPQGIQGVQGPVGPQGPTGLQGDQGLQGVAGANGQDGAQGPQGPQGPAGATGPQGPQGPAGAQGVAGTGITFKGAVSQDPSGSGDVTLTTSDVFTPSEGDAVLSQVDDSLFIFDGSDWVDGGSIQGPQGPAGAQGIQGVQGPQGLQGPTGANGAQGPAGQDGAQGPQGAAGASVTNLTITNTTIAATLSDNSTISGTVSMSLTSLTDVDITNTAHTLSDGHVLTWDSTHNHWHPEAATDISVGSLSVGNTSVDLTDTGSDGTITFNTEGTNRWQVSSSGHIIPNGNALYDIGEAENKVRHFYLSNNSLIFESGSLGVDDNNDLSFTPSGGEASKIATQAYVAANAGGGGGGGGSAERMIMYTNYANPINDWHLTYAFSTQRKFVNNTYGPSSGYTYIVVEKGVQNTTVESMPAYGLYNTKFPSGNYKYTWHSILIPTATYGNGYYVPTSHADAMDKIRNIFNAITGLMTGHQSGTILVSNYWVDSSTPYLEVKFEFIITLSSLSKILIHTTNGVDLTRWISANHNLVSEYQEIERISDTYFTSTLTLQ